MPVPSEIAQSPSVPLKFKATDEDTAQKVKEFMAQMAEDGKAPPPIGEVPTPQAPVTAADIKLNVPPNTDFDIPIPGDRLLREAMLTPDKIPLTDEDKSVFLKCLLTDTPIRMTIPLYGGRMTIDLRARYNHEQRRIFDVLTYEQDKKLTPNDNPAFAFNRMQLFCAALMVERLNGKLISDLVLPPKGKVEEDRKALNDVVEEKFETMTLSLWTSVLQAMRVFEYKCARLNEEALNEGFWNPRGQEA